MAEDYVFDNTGLERIRGRYAVFGDDGHLAAQGDDLNEAMHSARSKGVKTPAIIDLELAEDQTYVFRAC